MLPKARSLDHVAQLQEALERIGHAAKIVAMVENAAGIVAMEQAAPVPERLAAIYLGTEDLAADLQVSVGSPLIAAAFDRLALVAARCGTGLMDFTGSM